MDIIVIGAGAAGLMAAIQAAAAGAKVKLLEQNEKAGRKILVTGNGKCNVSNTDTSPIHYTSHCSGRVAEVIEQFTFEDTHGFLEGLGILLKDRNGWLYPYGEQAQAVVSLLERRARNLGVSIKTREKVTHIEPLHPGFQVHTETWSYRADKVILTTGGPASAVEGSSRGGMDMAAALGHHIYEPLPALVPLKIAEKAYCVWGGTRMDGEATLYIQGKPVKTAGGEIQFTDYGISGIAVFQLSIPGVAAVAAGEKTEIVLDLFPQFTLEELTAVLEERRKIPEVKREADLFTGLLPDRMVRALVGKKEKSSLAYAKLLKGLTVTLKGAHSMERAQVANGGVDLQEINPKTMESLLQPGLYLAGEVLDVCGECGGYNLQWAWSSGAVAGKMAAKEE